MVVLVSCGDTFYVDRITVAVGVSCGLVETFQVAITVSS